MSTKLVFHKLNEGWNADPNAPEPSGVLSGSDLLLSFSLNAFQFPRFAVWDLGVLRFVDCSQHRFSAINDEGWYRGQCRYSKSAPAWGEFYELTGTAPHRDDPDDWITHEAPEASRHFLFYFRDETFECFAANWVFEPTSANSLFTHFGAN
ncbi:MAG: hypothetical protein JWN71_724 [Xanthobacteraceae bacterium]|nr:hypothetical protein [Xanthobacteraceae bacterium]